jgi:hypothetical protein
VEKPAGVTEQAVTQRRPLAHAPRQRPRIGPAQFAERKSADHAQITQIRV